MARGVTADGASILLWVIPRDANGVIQKAPRRLAFLPSAGGTPRLITAPDLGDAIVSNIDDWAELNRRQVLAYGACEKRFSVNEAASMLTSAFKQQSLVNA